MLSEGVSKLNNSGLIVIVPGVEVNKMYYCDFCEVAACAWRTLSLLRVYLSNKMVSAPAYRACNFSDVEMWSDP